MLLQYKDIATSLLRYSADVADRIKRKYGFDLTPVDFDTYGDDGVLPEGDLIGWSNWSLIQAHEDVGFSIEGGIGFSVVNDLNLTRLNMHYIDEILLDINSKCPPINIYEGAIEVEQIVGHFAFSGAFEITNVTTNKGRSYKFLAVTLRSEERIKYHRV